MQSALPPLPEGYFAHNHCHVDSLFLESARFNGDRLSWPTPILSTMYTVLVVPVLDHVCDYQLIQLVTVLANSEVTPLARLCSGSTDNCLVLSPTVWVTWRWLKRLQWIRTPCIDRVYLSPHQGPSCPQQDYRSGDDN